MAAINAPAHFWEGGFNGKCRWIWGPRAGIWDVGSGIWGSGSWGHGNEVNASVPA